MPTAEALRELYTFRLESARRLGRTWPDDFREAIEVLVKKLAALPPEELIRIASLPHGIIRWVRASNDELLCEAHNSNLEAFQERQDGAQSGAP